MLEITAAAVAGRVTTSPNFFSPFPSVPRNGKTTIKMRNEKKKKRDGGYSERKTRNNKQQRSVTCIRFFLFQSVPKRL